MNNYIESPSYRHKLSTKSQKKTLQNLKKSLSIGESEAHKVVMTTIRSEETTIPVVFPEDQTVIVKDDEFSSLGSSFPASSTTVRTSEGTILD